jgi:hypothetical protein
MQVFGERACRIEHVAVESELSGRVVRGDAHFSGKQPDNQKWKISLVSHACVLSEAWLY